MELDRGNKQAMRVYWSIVDAVIRATINSPPDSPLRQIREDLGKEYLLVLQEMAWRHLRTALSRVDDPSGMGAAASKAISECIKELSWAGKDPFSRENSSREEKGKGEERKDNVIPFPRKKE